MGFGIPPSFSNIAKNIGSAVGEAAGKVAGAVTQQAPAAPAQAPASQKPVDSFESAPAKPPVVCGGTDTAGAQCLPNWGANSGGGGGPAGANPSNR